MKKEDVKFYIKTLGEITLPTYKDEVVVEVIFSDKKIPKREDKIKGEFINSVFEELILEIGEKSFAKNYQKNVSYILQNAWTLSIAEKELGGSATEVYKHQLHINGKLSPMENLKKFLLKIKHKILKRKIRYNMRLKKGLIKTLKTESSRIIKYNTYNIEDPKELIIFEFYVFVLAKTIDLGDGLRILNKKKHYRNELILSRSLLELNFKFFYLVKYGEDDILNFMLKTGVRNLEVRLGDKFRKIKDLLKNEFQDLEMKGNKFKNLELVAEELGKKKYYNHFFSLYSRFAHTNALVINSYLNDFKDHKDFHKSVDGDHYKNNNQYYVMSNVFFYEIIVEVFNFMVKNNYMPSDDFFHKKFLEQLMKDRSRWEKLNQEMEEIMGVPY